MVNDQGHPSFTNCHLVRHIGCYATPAGHEAFAKELAGYTDGVFADAQPIPKSRFNFMTVNGIGGLFFRSADPDARAAWYHEHLGVSAGQTELWQQEAGITVFAPFPKETDYFEGDQAFMLNFRVDDVEALAARLEVAGIAVERRDEWTGTDYGTFVRIHDSEGLPIELWEPPSA